MTVPQKLETKRLFLRSLNKDDIKSIQNLISNKETMENLYLNAKFKEIKNLFGCLINDPKSITILVIQDKETENFLGFCGLKDLEDTISALTFYALLPKYRGYGYAIEFMKKLFEYAFIDLELSKIIALINPKHSKSWKVAERIGMKYMGHVKYKNYNPDPMLFTIEKIEFKAQRAY
ncbi:MAG: GNAT family N-acetyltransferase [Promethearchaeota archaeon]